MLGALMIHGISPGPSVMTQRPDLFWGLIASMWIGNLMLVVLNLPLIGLWVSLLKVPYRLLFPAIMVFSCIGIYSVNGSSFHSISQPSLVSSVSCGLIRLSPCAVVARVCSRADDGGKPPAGATSFARKSHGVSHATDQPGVCHRHGIHCCRNDGADDTQTAGRHYRLMPV